MLKKNVRKTHLVKNKGLRRVCAVVCLCFALLSVALPFSRSRRNLTVSAAATTVVVPDNSYIVSLSRPPAFYVGWANYNLVTTLTVAPTLFISRSGFYCSFGGTLYSLAIANGTWSGHTAPPNSTYIQSPFFKTTDGSTPISPSVNDVFGYAGFISATSKSAEYIYDNLINGNYSITSVSLSIIISPRSSTEWDNYSQYSITYMSNNVGLNPLDTTFTFVRNESSSPFPSGFKEFRYYSSEDSYFSYVVTYNGLSTSSQEYQAGYLAGQTEGYNRGYNIGNTDGQMEGYNRGFDVGVSQKLSDVTPWQVIVDGVNGFLNIEVLPSVKLSIILSVAFGIILLGFVIKIFLGG